MWPLLDHGTQIYIRIKGLNVEYLVSRNICLFNDLFKQKVAQQNKRESSDPIQNPNPTLICFI